MVKYTRRPIIAGGQVVKLARRPIIASGQVVKYTKRPIITCGQVVKLARRAGGYDTLCNSNGVSTPTMVGD